MVENFAVTALDLTSIAAEFYRRGWLLGTSGNLSAVLDREPLRLAITPSGADKSALKAEQIISIDEKARTLNGALGKPSDESPLHLRIVNERQAGAVFHTHSVWSTMLSDFYFAEGGLAIEGYEMLKGLAGVQTHEHREWMPIIENSQDMWELADTVAKTLEQHPSAHGLLLRRHGLYAWGADCAQAKRHVEILEFLFETVGRTQLRKEDH